MITGGTGIAPAPETDGKALQGRFKRLLRAEEGHSGQAGRKLCVLGDDSASANVVLARAQIGPKRGAGKLGKGHVRKKDLLHNHVPIRFSALWTYRGYIRHYKIDKENGSWGGFGRIQLCLLWDSPIKFGI